MKKYVFVICLLLAILLVSMGLTTIYVTKEEMSSEESFTIVTSFYPIYIATWNVTDKVEGVRLENLSEPQTGCLHDFQLTPEDLKLLSTADVFVVNGAGVETFLEDVAKTYPELTILSASEFVELLCDEEEINGHGWLDISRYQDMVVTIAEELAKADTNHGKFYKDNADAYVARLQPLLEKQASLKSKWEDKKVVLLHEAFAYVAEGLDMQISYVMDLDEERQISAGEVADVVSLIKKEDVKTLLVEERYGKEMAETLQKETGVQVIYLDPLNRGDYDKESYITNMNRNLELLQ